MIATFVNCAAVILGALIGLLVSKNLKTSFKEIVMSCAGITTLIAAFQMALKTSNLLVMLFSLLIGGFLGHILKIEEHVLALGDRIGNNGTFGAGFLNASVLFCSGAMAVVGSISAGTTGDASLIYLKSVMDGFMAIVFAAAYGPGVLLSAASILVYQGFFTLSGGFIGPLLGDIAINELAAVGGALLIMIALGLLDIKKFKTGNFLPAMICAPVLAKLFIK